MKLSVINYLAIGWVLCLLAMAVDKHNWAGVAVDLLLIALNISAIIIVDRNEKDT